MKTQQCSFARLLVGHPTQSVHHLQLNRTKTELFFFPTSQALQHNFNIKIKSIFPAPSLISPLNEWMNKAICCTKSARGFTVFNFRNIGPYVTQKVSQMLKQTLVFWWQNIGPQVAPDPVSSNMICVNM